MKERNTNRIQVIVFAAALVTTVLLSVVTIDSSFANEKCRTLTYTTTMPQARIAILQGHGEADSIHVADLFAGLKEKYEVSFLSLQGKVNTFHDTTFTDGKIHNRYDAIIMIGPDSAFSKKDLFLIDQFIMYGGKALFCVDGTSANMDSVGIPGQTIVVGQHYGIAEEAGLEDLLFTYGARLNPSVVEDMHCAEIVMVTPSDPPSQFTSEPWVFSPVLFSQKNLDTLENFEGIKFDFVSPIDTVQTAGFVKKDILLRSSKQSKVLRTPFRAALSSALQKPDPAAFNQPYQTVAVLLEGSFDSFFRNKVNVNAVKIGYLRAGVGSKIMVIGDGDVAINPVSQGQAMRLGFDRFNRLSKNFYANKTFLLNCMNALLQ